MLILQRRINQDIIFHTSDGDIVLSVYGLTYRGRALKDTDTIRVKLGIEAPKSIKVLRSELED